MVLAMVPEGRGLQVQAAGALQSPKALQATLAALLRDKTARLPDAVEARGPCPTLARARAITCRRRHTATLVMVATSLGAGGTSLASSSPAPSPPPGPVDPNCAVGQYFEWNQYKKEWCCRNHHICGRVTQPPAPADPYNCADGFANWQAGWSVNKKEWCCRV